LIIADRDDGVADFLKFHQSTLTLAQTVLAQSGPRAVLISPAEGGWPLSPDEMLWQIELLQEPEAAG
jgi:hypothetical protein